jgi:Pectate lyase superfamily protein
MAGTYGIYNVQAAPYRAAGDGTSDDTEAINAAIADAAINPYGGIVFFPPGTYATSAPLVVQMPAQPPQTPWPGPGVVLYGGGPLSTNGEAGSYGTGSSFTQGNFGGVVGEFDGGATIKPLPGWSAAGAAHSAVVLFDGYTYGGIAMCEAYRIRVDGGNLPVQDAAGGAFAADAFALFDNCGACSLRGCSAITFYSTAANGINAPGGSDGCMLESCLIQNVGGTGVTGAFGDATISRVHTQVTGGRGFNITGRGGNIRLTDCRGDLSVASSGFQIAVESGSYMGMVQLNNCSTQGNYQNGFHLLAPTSASYNPVYLSNCVAQGDATGGSGSAGFRFDGPVVASLSNCATHVNDSNDKLAPQYAIITDGNSYGKPVMISVLGGFYNCADERSWADQIMAPEASLVETFVCKGRQWRRTRRADRVSSL